MPASGFFIRHVKNISLTGCEFTTAKPDARPALYMNDVINSKFTDLTIGSNTASEAAIWLNQVHDVVVKDCLLRMPQSFIRAEGNETSAVFITGNILTYSRQVVTADPKVKKVVVESGNIRQKN